MVKKPGTEVNEKVIVLTGATSGIGLAAAAQLAEQGALVLGVGRSVERCRKAEDQIRAEVPHARFTCLTADLSSQQQIHSLYSEIHAELEKLGINRLDVLVNNAAMVTNWFTASENGYEMQFAVNHLAPFLLTYLLFPLLKESPAGRVLTVSSMSHRGARIHWKDIMLRHRYNTLRAYKQSKLANVLFSMELNRRFADESSICAFAIDPGLVNTNIGMKGTSGFVHWFWDRRRRKGAPPSEPAKTIVHVALDPEIQASQGVYWKECRPVPPARSARKEEDAARLWQLSQRLCGISDWG
ncbi:MAG: SDR family NAD(P)-dependent oxidoreductase [Anaerolineales bacterium]|nr:SDR family NAD(P)-dependent oxidoreductase [Anaerolineales bacterium]